MTWSAPSAPFESTWPPVSNYKQDDPKIVWSWAIYDWANSAFTTLVVTFIYSTYFTRAMMADDNAAEVWWLRAVSLSAILTALAAPFLGAAADRGGARKRFLIISTLVCLLATTALAFVSPTMAYAPFIALAIFVVADFSYETGQVFYNSFLPSIASPARIGRISGWAWALGYVGGTLLMLVALVGFVQPDVPWFGMTKEAGWNVRATNLLVVGWFLVFSLPMFFLVPEKRVSAQPVRFRAAVQELMKTARNIRQYGELFKFLLARLVFNDGLVTIFTVGAIYGQGTFKMDESEVVIFGIALNVTAGLGAFVFGSVDDKFGGKRTILITLVGLATATAMSVWAPTKTWFWVSGMLLGIFVGPNQSASRSLMGRFVPAKHESEFFGFFAFSGKATAFAGPMLVSSLIAAFDSQRAGVASIVVFFVVGGLLLMTVDEKKGIAAAEHS